MADGAIQRAQRNVPASVARWAWTRGIQDDDGEHPHRLPELCVTSQRPGQQDGLDATNEWSGATEREWGRATSMDADVQQRMDGIFVTLGL